MTFIFNIIIGILNLIFACFKLLPVKEKVTFISRQSNEKSEDMIMLEAELLKENPDVELVFLCKKIENGIVPKLGYCFHMLSQMYHIATSKVVVLDSYCICISCLKQRQSLTVIQMWHALGALKKFGLSIVGEGEGSSRNIAEAMRMHKNYSYILTSGKACEKYFAEAFGYDESHMKVMSLPRVDKITDENLKNSTIRRILNAYPEFQNKKVVVYAPTFRKNKDISKDIDKLAQKFDDSEYAFVLKKHPLMNVSCEKSIVDHKFTTLEMLFAADYVICDYSAVVFEAAVLKKPLFFYTFDYKEYGVNRDFYIDYMREMPGIISEDASIIAKAVIDDDFDLDRVCSFAGKYIEHQSGCSHELASFILQCIQ